MDLPEYRCHKVVRALKITDIRFDSDVAAIEGRETDGGAFLIPENEVYAAIKVTRDFLMRHTPVAGGYYVVYDDNYSSYSPAKAFEAGYDLIAT